MPYHLCEENLRSKIATRLLGEDQTLGTTCKGIGPCYADKASRDTAIRIADLFEMKMLKSRLEFILRIKNATLAALAAQLDEPFVPIKHGDLVSLCKEWASRLRPYVCDTSTFLIENFKQGKRILFEGANAALLDIDHGTYPFVTSSNGSTLGITSGTGIPTSMIGKKIGVAKAYMSRVGTGPFVTELFGPQADQLREVGLEYGSTTGRPRRVGWLDLPALRAMVEHNGIDELVITGLAVLTTLDQFQVCTGYTLNGAPVNHVPASVGVIRQLKPVYQQIKVTSHLMVLESSNELSGWVMELIRLIDQSVTHVSAVCIGKRRDQVLWLQSN